jgi:TRAP transporter TAXI family solute receptor
LPAPEIGAHCLRKIARPTDSSRSAICPQQAGLADQTGGSFGRIIDQAVFFRSQRGDQACPEHGNGQKIVQIATAAEHPAKGGNMQWITAVLLYLLITVPAFSQVPPQDLGASANAGTVGIITGMEGGTYARTGSDLTFLDSADLRVLVTLGKGSLQNLSDILYLKGVDVGFVQADALTYAKQHNLFPNLTQRIRYIAKLYDEEIHVLARKNINTLQDLNGQRVNVDVSGSGSAMTAEILLDALGIKAKIEHARQVVGVEELEQGEIAAVIHVGGAPIPLFANIPASAGLHFLPVALTTALAQVYLPDQFMHDAYPALIPAGAPPVQTIAVGDVMAVYGWPPHTDRYNKVKRFVDAFFSRFEELRHPPHHPKWLEVNLTAEVPGWTRFQPAQDWLVQHTLAGTANPATQIRFNTFLSHTDPAINSQLTDAAKAVLFQQFQVWDRRHPSGN